MMKKRSPGGFVTLLGILIVMIVLPAVIAYVYFHSITPKQTIPNRDVNKIREQLDNLPPQGALDNAEDELYGIVTPTNTPSPTPTTQPNSQTSTESLQPANQGKGNSKKPNSIEVMN